MMDTKASITAARAIASVLVKRYLFTLSIIGSVTLLLVWVISILLVFTHTSWWLLLAFAVLPLLIIFASLSLVTLLISVKLSPRKLTKNEQKQIKAFVDEFGAKAVATKGVKKNPAALSGIIAWKYVKGRGKQPITGILMEPINDAKNLRTKFQEITELF